MSGPSSHRLSGLRTQTSGLSSSAGGAPLTTPFTPTRSSGLGFSSASGGVVPSSPSAVRAEDDFIVVEAGARGLRVGMAGDATPKMNLRPTPELGRRVGDVRRWQAGWRDDWRRRGAVGDAWTREHELWGADLRGLDLGLVEDKVERLLRDGFRRFLLLDYKPRKACVVVSSSLGIHQVSALLDVLFKKFTAAQAVLFSTATMAAVGAGVRSALAVDLGWAETVVTSVYEFREVRTTRTVRAGKMLVEATNRVLARALRGGGEEDDGRDQECEHVVSFDECEEVCMRLMWCKPDPRRAARRPSTATTETQEAGGLATVQEQDESDAPPLPPQLHSKSVKVPLQSTDPPATVEIPFDSLAHACERTFIAPDQDHAQFDDDELPVHLLIYNHLVQLPVDVRAICMARIVFTGGCANVLGLRQRILDEVIALAERRDWSPILGKNFVDRTKLPRAGVVQPAAAAAAVGPIVVVDNADQGSAEGDDGSGGDAHHNQSGVDESMDTNTTNTNTEPEIDPVERELRKHRPREPPTVQGTLRALETTGAWAGGSLMAHLRVPAMVQIDKEAWLKHGVAGASRPTDVDVKIQQRHSMGAGSTVKPGEQPWTLGAWGGTW